jgi:hypothetical protein
VDTGCESAQATDPKNCGTCGHDCKGVSCAAGLCTPTVIVQGEASPGWLAVDSTYIYWTTYVANTGQIRRAPLTGGTPVTLASNQNQPAFVAVDATTVYWDTNAGGTVMKVAITGGTPVEIATGQNWPAGIAADATGVYWANDKGNTISRLPLAGGTPQVIASASSPCGPVLDANYMYFADRASGNIMKVLK